MYPQASKVGNPDRKYLSVTLCRQEDQCPDVHLDAMMEMVLAAHTEAITSPEQAPSLLGRVDRGCASQLALSAPLWAHLPPNCSGSGPFHPHPCPGGPGSRFSYPTLLADQASALSFLYTNNKVLLSGLPADGQRPACWHQAGKTCSSNWTRHPVLPLSRPLGTTAWMNTKDRTKSTSPALYQVPILYPHKLIVLYSYPSRVLMLGTPHRGQNEVTSLRGIHTVGGTVCMETILCPNSKRGKS